MSLRRSFGFASDGVPTFLRGDVELLELAGSGAVGCGDVADVASHGRLDRALEAIQFDFPPFDDQFNPSVRKIADEPGDAEPRGDVPRGVAKADALNMS